MVFMSRRAKSEEDELDRLLSDPDLLGDEEEIEAPTLPGDVAVAAPAAAVQALVQSSPALAASVYGAREACVSARESLARARDEVDKLATVEDPEAMSLLAWLACMDELLRFADQLGETLTGK